MKRDNTVTSMDTEVKAMEEQLTKLREENDEVCENQMFKSLISRKAIDVPFVAGGKTARCAP